MEVEALESILMEDMRVVEGSEGIAGATHAPCYQIAVSALGDGEEEDPNDATQTARLGLVFSHTPSYPATPPLLRCRSIEGLFEKELVEVTDMLEARGGFGRHGDDLRPGDGGKGVDARPRGGGGRGGGDAGDASAATGRGSRGALEGDARGRHAGHRGVVQRLGREV